MKGLTRIVLPTFKSRKTKRCKKSRHFASSWCPYYNLCFKSHAIQDFFSLFHLTTHIARRSKQKTPHLLLKLTQESRMIKCNFYMSFPSDFFLSCFTQWHNKTFHPHWSVLSFVVVMLLKCHSRFVRKIARRKKRKFCFTVTGKVCHPVVLLTENSFILEWKHLQV